MRAGGILATAAVAAGLVIGCAAPGNAPVGDSAGSAVSSPSAASPLAVEASRLDVVPPVWLLIARANENGEYSFEHRMSVSGVSVTGRVYVKGLRVRQELSLAGQATVMILDLEQKQAYTLDPDGQTATMVDLAELAAQGSNETPTQRVQSLPSDLQPVGLETVDGKPTVVYDVAGQAGSIRLWIWTERGVPVRMELPNPQARLTVEMTGYQFVPQPDELFELPPGITVVEVQEP